MQYEAEFLKIAVVDDEPLWQQKTVDVIEKKYGLDAPHIDRYSSGRELLDRNTYYDILFMDIEMEGLDGFETAKRYQKQYEYAKIAMLTSHTELSRRGYVVNAFRYIDKACMEAEITEAISACTMHEMEDLVKGCGFYRSHRSYLINLDETINYEGMNIIMSDGTKAYLSKDKQSEFKEKLLARKFEMANG